MYSARRIKIWNIAGLWNVVNILYMCGKDMAKRYGLHHWDNAYIKTWMIFGVCILKNQIYLVLDGKIPVATFQVRKIRQSYLFQKLATAPQFAGKGIGTFCMQEIEQLARSENCAEIICEVYDKSEHAKRFYKHQGYAVYDQTETLKYKELKLRKQL